MHPTDPTPSSEPQPQLSEMQAEAALCIRCAKLEAKLEKVEQQRDELVVETRQWTAKAEQLLRENGDLRERCAKFESWRASCNSHDTP